MSDFTKSFIKKTVSWLNMFGLSTAGLYSCTDGNKNHWHSGLYMVQNLQIVWFLKNKTVEQTFIVLLWFLIEINPLMQKDATVYLLSSEFITHLAQRRHWVSLDTWHYSLFPGLEHKPLPPERAEQERMAYLCKYAVLLCHVTYPCTFTRCRSIRNRRSLLTFFFGETGPCCFTTISFIPPPLLI